MNFNFKLINASIPDLVVARRELYIKKNYETSKKLYTPQNPFKYIGLDPIHIRDSKEEVVMRWLDQQPKIKYWSSESTIIDYVNPETFVWTHYFPDIWCMDIANQEYLVEVKAKSQVDTEKTKAKHHAAEIWCNENNIKWHVLTEDDMFSFLDEKQLQETVELQMQEELKNEAYMHWESEIEEVIWEGNK